MKIRIEVADKAEGEIIKRALDDPATRALVKVTGLFLMLDTDRSRSRVLNYIADKLGEEVKNAKGSFKGTEMRVS